MKKTITLLLLLVIVEICFGQINWQVNQFQPTFYKSNTSGYVDAHAEYVKAQKRRSDTYMEELQVFNKKIINYLEGETDTIFQNILIGTLDEIGQYGSTIDINEYEELLDYEHIVDMAYAEFLERKSKEKTESASPKARLEKLLDLYAVGLISEEEYNKRKQEILNEL